MDIAHFITLAIERGMISNKYGLEIFYSAYRAACASDFEQQQQKGRGNKHQ